MAPALTEAAREPDAFTDTDAVSATDKRSQTQRRRALTSVDNVGPHMDEDDMGLQSEANLSKDSQEMDQILVDLGGSDLAQTDLLQAIKTLESGGDVLSAGDAEAIFPLSGFDLTEAVEPDSDAAEDKVRLMQARLERRCAFLQRRLRILQAREIGKRISEESAQSIEKCSRGARRDGSGRPIGLKAFLKRIETTAALQANAASRTVVGPRYFHAGTSSIGDISRSASIGVPTGTLTGLGDTAGALRSHLTVVKHSLDSDATVSSSGAESNDEAVTYNNPHQRPMPIEKRALWSWQRARASIASRWCWLQAQVQELEYKIRQHTDLHRQVRAAKGPVEFEGEPVGYEGPLPGASELPDDDPVLETCARVRPLRRETFKKRKLLQMHNLHMATAKAAKPADIRCGCSWPAESCAVCTGRAVATQPAPPHSTLAPAQRLALLDPAYHPVLSDIRDVSPPLHLAALASRAWFRSRCSKAARGAHHAAAPAPAPRAPAAPAAPAARRPPTRLKRGRPPLSRKVRDVDTDTSTSERPRGRTSTDSTRHSRVNSSYDIDNIVIPQSVAANTRPEILHYKEILTPKWRVMEFPDFPLNNGVVKTGRASATRVSTDRVSATRVSSDRAPTVRVSSDRTSSTHVPSDRMAVTRVSSDRMSSTRVSSDRMSSTRISSDRTSDSEEEDISDAAISARHTLAEARERSRYMRKQRSRRSHHANSADGDTTSATTTTTTTSTNTTNTTTTSTVVTGTAPLIVFAAAPPPRKTSQDEIVRPYTPRQFPLSDAEYAAMAAAPSPSPSPPRPPPRAPSPPDDDDEWEPARARPRRPRPAL